MTYVRVLLVMVECVVASGLAAAGPPLTVAPTLGQCGAQFTRIQDAIAAAAPNGTIRVCAGVYDEQLHITKSLTIIAEPDVVIRPSAAAVNGTSLSSGNAFASIIFVENAENVILRGFTVDGVSSAPIACAPRFLGVTYQNASGEMEDLDIQNIRLANRLNGCQSGTGVLVQSGNRLSSNVTIKRNRLSTYQKNGITADGTGTYVSILKNRVTGLGPTPGAAQNGIQIGFGSTGKVEHNTISENQWSPCVSTTECAAFATGILVVQSDDVIVRNNASHSNQVNIFSDGERTTIERNLVLDAVVFDGIQIQGPRAKVEENTIARADEAGINVFGDYPVVRFNRFLDCPIGILESAPVVGAIFDPNVFIDVDQNIVVVGNADGAPATVGARKEAIRPNNPAVPSPDM